VANVPVATGPGQIGSGGDRIGPHVSSWARMRSLDGSARGTSVGVAPVGDGSMRLAVPGEAPVVVDADALAGIEGEVRPRWVTWSPATLRALVALGLRPAMCWDVVTVHRLLVGRWRVREADAWAWLHDLDPPAPDAPLDLFTEPPADGQLGPDGAGDPSLALEAAAIQQRRLEPTHLPTARSESTAELLCAELEADGLPMDRSVAESIVAAYVGSRDSEAQERARRDEAVLGHAPPGSRFDLRSPNDVRSLLRRIGIEVPDTRAWRLEAMQDAHPLIPALLGWRKAERIGTAFGYSWLDAHLGADGRLRGEWTGSDGAAGRMTATAGLHNMPAELRPAVQAEPGHVFVRADLGQIEPRVLAAVSGDRALATATADADMYAPVARQLGVDRAVAKVAVLGAMYGQTTGRGAEALRGLERAYPVAMAYLTHAAQRAAAGQDVRTAGGRIVRMGGDAGFDVDEREARRRASARGRYGRNAVVQGAAAELFKMWALIVRARALPIVLCLHDELLVHVPATDAAAAVTALDECLQEAAARWSPGTPVRFVAEVSVVERWSDAK